MFLQMLFQPLFFFSRNVIYLEFLQPNVDIAELKPAHCYSCGEWGSFFSLVLSQPEWSVQKSLPPHWTVLWSSGLWERIPVSLDILTCGSIVCIWRDIHGHALVCSRCCVSHFLWALNALTVECKSLWSNQKTCWHLARKGCRGDLYLAI